MGHLFSSLAFLVGSCSNHISICKFLFSSYSRCLESSLMAHSPLDCLRRTNFYAFEQIPDWSKIIQAMFLAFLSSSLILYFSLQNTVLTLHFYQGDFWLELMATLYCFEYLSTTIIVESWIEVWILTCAYDHDRFYLGLPSGTSQKWYYLGTSRLHSLLDWISKQC